MSVFTRPAVLLASATVAAGLFVAPGSAWAADTTSTLTAAEMRAALRAAGTASAAAGAGGWGAVVDFTSPASSGGELQIKDTYSVDPVHGRYSEVVAITGYPTSATLAAEGKGVYYTAGDSQQTAALKMMGRPSVKYVFTANKSLKLSKFVRDNAPDPATLVEYYSLPGTKTVHDDGSADFRVVDPQNVTVVMHTDAASVLTGVDMSSPESDGVAEVAVAYSYEAQAISLPAATATIDQATMAKGLAYLDMPATVKYAADWGAADTRTAAKGRKVKVATLRILVRRDVTETNRSVGVSMVKVKNITSGVRVYAVNPWTKKSVSYTVKAAGRKVVVKKA